VERGQPIAILAVDDESGVSGLVCRSLGDDQRLTLIEASSSKEPLERIAQDPVLDLLISDRRRLEMEGDALARDVCTQDADPKVPHLTSHTGRLIEAHNSFGQPRPISIAACATGLREAIGLNALGPHDSLKTPA
jgi:DNA-binding NtrC family response regulator